jgi:hypothetical protein
VDGTAHASVVIGDVVYVGGDFSNGVAPAGAKTARNNLAAFCLANGQLLSSFVADVNAQVWALTSDGASLFVGGDFTALNGRTLAKPRLVKLNATTGAQITGFDPPTIPNVVYALDYSGGKVYAGGDFSAVDQAGRTIGKKGVSVDHDTGAFAGWNPDADARIQALKVSPDGQWVFIGGTFETVGGLAHNDLARTSAGSGAVSAVSFGDNQNVSGRVNGHVFSIAVDSDSVSAYASTGPSRPKGSNGGNKLISYASDGRENWRLTFNGDNQAVVLIGNTLYTGFHGGFQNNTNLRLLGFNKSSHAMTSFSPNSNGVLGVRGLAISGNGLVAVGDFSAMGSTTKLHGVAIFN